jgi:predicted nucleic acid-binding protein
MILVDTNVLIEYYKNNPLICGILEQIDPQETVVNDVVCAELYFGSRNRQELAAIVSDMEKLTVLAITPTISRLSVDLVKQFCLSHKLKLPDAQIAATAILHNAELFTLNRKDFVFIPNLKLYDWGSDERNN